jgi:hypothetical protein
MISRPTWLNAQALQVQFVLCTPVCFTAQLLNSLVCGSPYMLLPIMPKMPQSSVLIICQVDSLTSLFVASPLADCAAPPMKLSYPRYQKAPHSSPNKQRLLQLEYPTMMCVLKYVLAHAKASYAQQPAFKPYHH